MGYKDDAGLFDVLMGDVFNLTGDGTFQNSSWGGQLEDMSLNDILDELLPLRDYSVCTNKTSFRINTVIFFCHVI